MIRKERQTENGGNEMRCPKCGSENVFVQRVQEGSVGTSRTVERRHIHGLLYWLLIGWWIWFFKLLFLPLRILFGHTKKTGRKTTLYSEKTILRTMATCQQCGHSWKV